MPTKIKDESPLQKDGRGGRIIGGILGGVGGFLVGGPAGATAGYGLGSKLGGEIGEGIDERQERRGTGPYKEGGRLEHERFADANQTPGTTYIQTNINPYTGEEYQPYSPFAMIGKEKPLKVLTASPVKKIHNMSAAQYNSAVKMQNISGAATLMTADQEEAFGSDSELAKKDPARAKKIYEGIKENTKSAATAVGDVKKYSTIDDDPNQRAYSGNVKKYSTVDEAPNQRAYSAQHKKMTDYMLGQKISKGDTTSFELRPKGRNQEGFMEFNEVVIPNKEYERRMNKNK